MLLARILAPQVAALLVWGIVRLLTRERDPIFSQLAAVLIAALSASSLALSARGPNLTGPRLGAFIALEVFVALLAQLLIVAADETD